MDHICVSSLQFMNHGHTQPRFDMSKFNTGNRVSFDHMGMNRHSSTINTFVGTKSFMSKEELSIRPMKYSQLVGGFVGSKSQLGTSNRISCQIWDIVFCKLMSFMNSSSNVKSASSLESSGYSYTFVQDLTTDVFDSMYRNISEHTTHPAGSCTMATNTQLCNNLTPVNSEKHNLIRASAVPQQELHGAKLKETSKQSYADVTKTAKPTETTKGNIKHESILCSKSTVRTKNVQMIPVMEINTSKRKKQNCRRKKPNVSDCNAVKPQNSCKKGGGKFRKNDQRKMANLKVQNSMKRQKDKSASDGKNTASENTECDVNDTFIIFTNTSINKNTSLGFKKEQKFCTSLLPKGNKTEFEFVAHFDKKCAYQHMTVIPNHTSQDCSKKDTEFENSRIKGEDESLPKKPSFSHIHEIDSNKTNRFYSDSSDTDDFIIFTIAETDVQFESASDKDIGDCFSDCDIEEIWETQEKDTEEVDNQVSESLKEINETWQKMYSCFPGKPKEPKKVQFASNEKLKTVHSIIAWDFAYRAARIGHWQQIALDQDRFSRRILQLEQIISPVLTTEHRRHVHQRIMKYLNEVHSGN